MGATRERFCCTISSVYRERQGGCCTAIISLQSYLCRTGLWQCRRKQQISDDPTEGALEWSVYKIHIIT